MSFTEIRDHLRALSRREEGQTMAEYGLVLAVITVAIVGIFTALSGGIAASVNWAMGLV